MSEGGTTSMNQTQAQQQNLAFCVMRSNEPARLDQLLAQLFPDFSRSQLQRWIKSGQVKVDGKKLRPRDSMSGGEVILIEVPETVQPEWEAQPMELDIVFEDDEILVLNKPVGLVVHPGAGNPDSTLLNALLSHAPQLRSLPRAGIVHRLDKDTSGLMVVAKTERARLNLIEQLSSRELHREYKTVVMGVMISGGTVDEPIGRHRQDRKRMAVTEHGKPAISHYRVAARYRAHTLVNVKLATGRTHQIRVHMAYIHYPVVGDPVYGGRLKLPKNCSETLKLALRGFRRQALHAARLGLKHPVTGEELSWQCGLPSDMLSLIEALEQDAREHESY
jgi:23S rRNA pseudouridine1911/1915/1917 synthase